MVKVMLHYVCSQLGISTKIHYIKLETSHQVQPLNFEHDNVKFISDRIFVDNADKTFSHLVPAPEPPHPALSAN